MLRSAISAFGASASVSAAPVTAAAAGGELRLKKDIGYSDYQNSLGPKGFHRVNPHGPPRRDAARGERHGDEQGSGHGKRDRVRAADAEQQALQRRSEKQG